MSVNESFISASNFSVNIEGSRWDIFESVEGLGISFEDITFQDDRNMFRNRPGRGNAEDIILVRRFKNDPEFYDWVKQIKDGKFNTSRKSGSVIINDDEGKPLIRFNFTGAWPKYWKPPALNKSVEGNDTPMETIVLSVEDLELVR